MLEKNENQPFWQFYDLSRCGQLRLIDLAFPSLVFGISAIPFCAVAFALWGYALKLEVVGLVLWGIFYTAAAIGVRYIHKAYQLDRQTDNYELIISRWLPIIKLVASMHGIGLTIPFFILNSVAPFEFNLLYIVTVAAIIAAFATHLTPVLPAFLYLFIPCWSICLILMPWTFPLHWKILLFLAIIYAASMYKHALLGHQFFLRQIVLEEEISKLAESYRIAKIEAESALKAKNQFLTTASHDLRQPVHAMGFLIESIVKNNQDKLIEQALKDLKQSVASVRQMFNSLLDLSKIELGQVELKPDSIHLGKLIEELATMFREEAYAKNIEIRVRTVKEESLVNVDATLLRQSVMNLMHNALRYTERGGVLLAVRKRGSNWQIDVWDTGVGVALDEGDKILSPFYRSEHAWRIDSAGHGLGLSVVTRCCEMMGCKLGFRSKIHQGSHFWLRLPAMTGCQQIFKTVSPDQVDLNKTEDYHLSGICLIVDDDPQVTAAWKALLTTWGITVTCVESGVKAFVVLDAGLLPQVILCDQRLRSGESGFEVLQTLLSRCPDAHGAMVSGEFSSIDLQQAESEGYLVLRKPLEPELLHTVLSQWLSAK